MRAALLSFAALAGLLCILGAEPAAVRNPFMLLYPPGEATPNPEELFYAAKAAADGAVTPELEEQAVEFARQYGYRLMIYLISYASSLEPPLAPGESRTHMPGEHRRYPAAFADVIGDQTDPNLYANPFTARTPFELTGHAVPFGWTPEAPGNFTYLPHYLPGSAQPTGFVLLVYGPRTAGTPDYDGDGTGDGIAFALGLGSAIGASPRVLGSGAEELTLHVDFVPWRPGGYAVINP